MTVRPATPESEAKLRKALGNGLIVFGQRRPADKRQTDVERLATADTAPLHVELKQPAIPEGGSK